MKSAAVYIKAEVTLLVIIGRFLIIPKYQLTTPNLEIEFPKEEEEEEDNSGECG